MTDYKFSLTDQDEKDFVLLKLDFAAKVNDLIRDIRVSAVRQRAVNFLDSLVYVADDKTRADKIALVSSLLDDNMVAKPQPEPVPIVDEPPPLEPPIIVEP